MIESMLLLIIHVVLYFLLWTFCLYWIHRLAHNIPIIKTIHQDHHWFIITHPTPKWHWNNFFLFNDTWMSTLDLYITEVIPTLIFSWVTGQWWVAIFYYFWASLIQERIEHTPNVDFYPFLSSGRWHLIHHTTDAQKNFGAFTVLWDNIFRTAKNA